MWFDVKYMYMWVDVKYMYIVYVYTFTFPCRKYDMKTNKIKVYDNFKNSEQKNVLRLFDDTINLVQLAGSASWRK